LIGYIPTKISQESELKRCFHHCNDQIDSFNTFPGMYASASFCPNKWHITCFIQIEELLF